MNTNLTYQQDERAKRGNLQTKHCYFGYREALESTNVSRQRVKEKFQSCVNDVNCITLCMTHLSKQLKINS